MFKARPENETDTRILANTIKMALVDGDGFVSYADLSASINRDVQDGAYSILKKARKIIEREHGILIETMTNEGIKRTHDMCGTVEHTVTHISKATKRTMNRVVNAAKDAPLKNGEMAALNARLSQLGVISIFAKKKATNKIEGKIADMGIKTELPTAETLRLFEK